MKFADLLKLHVTWQMASLLIPNCGGKKGGDRATVIDYYKRNLIHR